MDKKVQTQRYRLGEPGEKWNQTPSLEQQGVPSYPPPMSPGSVMAYPAQLSQSGWLPWSHALSLFISGWQAGSRVSKYRFPAALHMHNLL